MDGNLINRGKSIEIGSNVWVGKNSCILKNTKIRAKTPKSRQKTPELPFPFSLTERRTGGARRSPKEERARRIPCRPSGGLRARCRTVRPRAGRRRCTAFCAGRRGRWRPPPAAGPGRPRTPIPSARSWARRGCGDPAAKFSTRCGGGTAG